MRIDPRVSVSPVDIQKSDAKATPAPAKPAGSSAAVVSLSSAASAYAPEETSATISARLDKIRAALAKGNYPVDLDLLASRIVDDEGMRGGKVS